MFIVKFPHVAETFYRALNEVLAPLLSSGNPATLMTEQVLFYNCDLLYHRDRIPDEPTGRPFICFMGERAGASQTVKCNDERVQRPYAHEIRQVVYRMVYVGIGKGITYNPPPYPDPPLNLQMSSQRDVENIWSQLALVIEHRHKDLHDRGIYPHVASMPLVPVQVPHLKYYLVRGEVTFEIRATLTRGTP